MPKLPAYSVKSKVIAAASPGITVAKERTAAEMERLCGETTLIIPFEISS
jgi:hypothetical protein